MTTEAGTTETGASGTGNPMIDGWSRERPDLDFSAMAAIMQAFGIHSAVHGPMT